MGAGISQQLMPALFLLWRRGKWTPCLQEWTFDDR